MTYGTLVKLRKFKFMELTKNSFSKKLISWYDKEAQNHLWRKLWQEKKDPYPVLVSEIMLQQTTIKVVSPSFSNFMKVFPTCEALSLASDEELRKQVAGLGYYRRFRRLKEAAQIVIKGSVDSKSPAWPRSYKEWIKLPGVGEYTASALASITLEEVRPLIDGNVERVFCRLFNWKVVPNLLKVKKKIFFESKKLILTNRPGDYNQAVMELGQTHCSLKNPSCVFCPVKKVCLSYEKQSQHEVPLKKIKPKFREVFLALTIFKDKELIFIRKREKSEKFLKEIRGFKTDVYQTKEKLNLKHQKSLGSFSHSITNYKLKVFVFVSSLGIQEKEFEAYCKSSLEDQLLANLDRKAWQLYLKKNK